MSRGEGEIQPQPLRHDPRPRLAVGCMTGTSIDALDCTLVEVAGRGLGLCARHLSSHSVELGNLRSALKDLAEQRAMTAAQIATLSHDFALLHARAVKELLDRAGVSARELALVCPHGQTVYHKPPVSWQLLNLPVLAAELGVTVVGDVRAADLALGGQGAPVTPITDWLTLRDHRRPNDGGELRVVVNLGGFCNATMLAPGEVTPQRVRGFDLCACNLLLDSVAWRVMGVRFDDGGSAALSAEPDQEALDDLLGVLASQVGPSGRSLGTGDEATAWIGRHWRGGAGCSGATLAATACEAIGQTLAARLSAELSLADPAGSESLPRVLLAGGGVHNAALVHAIASACTARVERTDALGVPAGAREAMAFAILGLLCADGVPITLPVVTGVRMTDGRAPISGVWAYPHGGPGLVPWGHGLVPASGPRA